MKYKIAYAYTSDVGKRRSNNQDNYICEGRYMNPSSESGTDCRSGSIYTDSNPLFGVFDGLGGEQCGEIASYLAAQEASHFDMGNSAEEAFHAFCLRANDTICRYAEQHGISSMGTTAAMLLFTPDGMTLCNIGDSKILRLRKGELEQISVDHVMEIYGMPKAPLTQNLGIPPEELIIEPYIVPMEYLVDDIYLICSDGLTDMVSPEDIQGILTSMPVDKAIAALRDTALANGGKDNVTIVLNKIEKAESKLTSFFEKLRMKIR